MTNNRYDMPAGFGPSLMPPMTTVHDAETVIISFETDVNALEALLPRHFTAAKVPVVTVARISYPATDYMGGRGYEEIVVSLSVRCSDNKESLNAGFAAVLWVNQFGALFSGREFQGLAKLMGELPPLESKAGKTCFTCSEYGSVLLRGEVGDLVPLQDEKLETVRRNSAAVPTFGWKYIPSASGAPDADYPTVNYTRWDYRQAWTATGAVEFMKPSAKDAPFSSRIVAALSALPVRRWRRAFVGKGTVIIDRTMTRRLYPEKVM